MWPQCEAATERPTDTLPEEKETRDRRNHSRYVFFSSWIFGSPLVSVSVFFRTAACANEEQEVEFNTVFYISMRLIVWYLTLRWSASTHMLLQVGIR